MNEVVIAATRADAEAAEAVRRHHAEMLGALRVHVDRMLSAVRDDVASAGARVALVAWCRQELLPHAAAEEHTLYRAAREQDRARALIEAMSAEHEAIARLVAEVEQAVDPVGAAAAARALAAVLEVHIAKENDMVLPLLLQATGVRLAALLEGLHDRFGLEAPPARPGCGGEGHACGCGGTTDEVPELDARAIPHDIRHATIFGALDGLAPGAGLVLIAPHDPLPLLQQLQERRPDAFDVGYLQRGPDSWRLAFTRRAIG